MATVIFYPRDSSVVRFGMKYNESRREIPSRFIYATEQEAEEASKRSTPVVVDRGNHRFLRTSDDRWVVEGGDGALLNHENSWETRF